MLVDGHHTFQTPSISVVLRPRASNFKLDALGLAICILGLLHFHSFIPSSKTYLHVPSAPSPRYSHPIHPQDTKPYAASIHPPCSPSPASFSSSLSTITPPASLVVFSALFSCGFLVTLPSPSLALSFSCRLLSRFFRRLFPNPLPLQFSPLSPAMLSPALRLLIIPVFACFPFAGCLFVVLHLCHVSTCSCLALAFFHAGCPPRSSTEFDDAPSIAAKKPVKSKWEAVKLARGNSDVEYDGDSVLDSREVEQGQEIKADLENAAVFFGWDTGFGGIVFNFADTSSEIDILISANLVRPRISR
ncbi:hypothetical protein DFH29DRAFT_1084352 [Suillus ampliporus]|nr:hypothetical protein DFH29DRAFT_1084352 [Suillus ampliporus]